MEKCINCGKIKEDVKQRGYLKRLLCSKCYPMNVCPSKKTFLHYVPRPDARDAKLTYLEVIRTDKWKKLVEEKMKLTNSTCERCGSTKYTHVYHKTQRSVGNEKIYNIITLCQLCSNSKF